MALAGVRQRRVFEDFQGLLNADPLYEAAGTFETSVLLVRKDVGHFGDVFPVRKRLRRREVLGFEI